MLLWHEQTAAVQTAAWQLREYFVWFLNHRAAAAVYMLTVWRYVQTAAWAAIWPQPDRSSSFRPLVFALLSSELVWHCYLVREPFYLDCMYWLCDDCKVKAPSNSSAHIWSRKVNHTRLNIINLKTLKLIIFLSVSSNFHFPGHHDLYIAELWLNVD